MGVPDSPTVPSLGDWAIMLAVAVTSFGGQLVLGRAYQIELAAKVAAINYVQVTAEEIRVCVCVWGDRDREQ